MRPRVFPAEDRLAGGRLAGGRGASMRPRVFPAEDVTNAGPRRAVIWSFNEAAGIPRGRPPQETAS